MTTFHPLMDPTHPLMPNTLFMMAMTQLEHYSAMLQVLQIEQVLDQHTNWPVQPADWLIYMADADALLAVIPCRRMLAELRSGNLKVLLVLDVFLFKQGFLPGSTNGLIDYVQRFEWQVVGWEGWSEHLQNLPLVHPSFLIMQISVHSAEEGKLIWKKHPRMELVDNIAELLNFFFSFSCLNMVEHLDIGELVDIMVLIDRMGGLFKSGVLAGAKATKGHQPVPSSTRCELWVMDNSLTCMHIVLWDHAVHSFEAAPGCMLVVKSAAISYLNGPCLKTDVAHTKVLTKYNNVATQALLFWYHHQGSKDKKKWQMIMGTYSSNGHADHQYIKAMETHMIKWATEKNLGKLSCATFLVEANILLGTMCKDYIYLGCSFKSCNKIPMLDWRNADGSYSCQQCGANVPTLGPKYHLNFKVMDGTKECWCHAFSSASAHLLGVDAGTMLVWRESNQRALWQMYERNIGEPNMHKWRVTVVAEHAKAEGFGDKINWVVIHFKKMEMA
ncbi:hypothetical protein DACRYDRAFT_15525 [Dacryopinax primogenitus]|uniref:Replication factor A C-terminal domain-containing protein n=1 Tax=Dacryopinax primogenitus (strain DJM 731) TaxID=1858805 RepID=M5G1P6_DACPD|nr:uncharacterized protein DACRYDRAFT_15525 [Dacryopinax primogenitus]EJU02135.1 hypothetical protein DACRYDRAFT_15525 [Dacryopinax primogenitus]